MQSIQLSKNRRPLILLTGAFQYTPDEVKRIESELGADIVFIQNESDNLDDRAKAADAIVCNGLFLHHDIKEFPNLKYIQLTSAGRDRIPEEEIYKRGISINDARGVYSLPMAEWALAVVLYRYKNLEYFICNKRFRIWNKNRTLNEISAKSVAIIGAGNVGREVAKRFNAFGASVYGFDRTPYPTDLFKEIFHIDTLANKISNFDIVIITAPATSETYHLFDSNLLSRLKQNAILVNISRGSLIDEKALISFLRSRDDIFVALDVYETEPLDCNNELWDIDNCFVSPHNSFVGEGNHSRMFEKIIENLKSFLIECNTQYNG